MTSGSGVPAWATLETLDPKNKNLTMADLQRRLFAPLAKHFVGVTLGGAAAARYEQSGAWGSELALPSSEQLVLRVSPANILQIFENHMTPPHVILVFRRRLRTSNFDQTRFCLFWHNASAETKVDDFTRLEKDGLTIGGRNCPLFALRVFCHHDAQRVASTFHGSENWATIDDHGFHIVRPHAYSVIAPRMVSMPAPGMSQWCIAAATLGLDLADGRRSPLEIIPEPEWVNQNERLEREVSNFLKEGSDKEPLFSSAYFNAFLATDALDCVGCITFLGCSIYEGAWPDALHLPGGVPLVVAMCIRLATSHRRFGLTSPPMLADELSNDRFRACFESQWAEFDEQGTLAIDLVIQRACNEAAQDMGPKLVREYLSCYRRSGQSCISRIFGLTREDLEDDDLPLSRLKDPATAAYAAVAKAQVGDRHAIQNDGLDLYSPALCPGRLPTQKTVCLFVASSVERWLRLGSIQGSSDRGAHHAKLQRRHSVSAGELRAKVRSGLAQAIAAEVGAGDEAEAMEMVERMVERLENLLQGCPDSMLVRCPTEEELLDTGTLPDIFSGVEPDDEDDDGDLGFDEASMQSAGRVLVQLFSHGPAAMFRIFGLSATLFSECSKLACADCDAEVSLLDTFMLESACPNCHRPRCLNCATVVVKQKKKHRPTSCLRCKKA